MGPPGVRRRRPPGRAAPPARRRRGDHAAADLHPRRDRAHRLGPRGGGRRGVRSVTPAGVWGRWIDDESAAIRAAGRWREPRSFDAAGPAGRLTATGQDVVSFASNDYLGLTR